ncbi:MULTISPECIES: ATP-binding protein [unclassified Roseitalea]|uniref:ATP-binding protein n=1 Tax=unclassified Roseitalea TaxID=2639107 RepID=UPI00273E3DEC|nr:MULTISPECIES: ATP-binding protein [unclassified Roseitalea]
MTGSLRTRVVVLSTIWTVLAVALLGWLLIGQYRANAQAGFADLQQAQLFNLIAAIGVSGEGALTGVPNLGDTAFLEAGSGWYWRVSLIDGGPAGERRSPSLGEATLQTPPLSEVPYDDRFRRVFETMGPAGNLLRVVETEIDLGEGRIGLFQLAGNQSEFDAAIAALAQNLALILFVFGVGVIALNGVIIVVGMRPLNRVRSALRAIQAGDEHALSDRYPDEIQPMVDEMNTLIDNNRRIVERARTQVGNLAHSLKTPISVLQNEAARGAPVDPHLVGEQARSMKDQVEHYLHRARIAAQAGGTAFRTDTSEAVRKLVRVMEKLNPEKTIVAHLPATPIAFAGEREDFEEICGNLLENAAKWGDGHIDIAIAPLEDAHMFEVSVSDDGPGISAEQRATALRRGQRLDETKPGSGLGLSIVVETVRAYRGDIALDRSAHGGLKVTLTLPRARAPS